MDGRVEAFGLRFPAGSDDMSPPLTVDLTAQRLPCMH
uniref:Uncharacterized protein n=1 Tax=Setaria italica TaxID=4555 RepID=K4AP67_SETIT